MISISLNEPAGTSYNNRPGYSQRIKSEKDLSDEVDDRLKNG